MLGTAAPGRSLRDRTAALRPLTSGPMNPGPWLILLPALALAWALLVRWLMANPRADFEAGVLYRLVQAYAFVFQRLRVAGRENIPRGLHAGPLIVVANHTSGVDPFIIQAACDFEIRWMMGRDMAPPRLTPLFDWLGVIFVNRGSRDAAAARAALRHVHRGGVLGVFPEGYIERPPRRLLPFQGGIGLVVARSRAPVLPVVVEGTPFAATAFGSLLARGRCRLTFMPIIEYPTQSADEITADLGRRFAAWTGWPESPNGRAGGPDT